MILFGDYHTHTVYSDGQGTVEQNVISAKEKGLKQIALTEHGYRHMASGIKRYDVPRYLSEIDSVRKNYAGVDVLYGIEANILSLKGDIDLTLSEQKQFDVIIVGFHKSFLPKTIGAFFNFWLPNNLPFFRSRPKQIEKNTQAFISAMKKK